jgi:hypothetical protein
MHGTGIKLKMIDIITAVSLLIAGDLVTTPRSLLKAMQWIRNPCGLASAWFISSKLVTLEVGLTDVMLINLYMACRIEAFTLK